jgi:hypothetical protein
MTTKFMRQVDARWLPGWSAPPDAWFANLSGRVDPNPNGNRAERRRAKKLGITHWTFDECGPR